jgi:hypothetical protein
MINLTHQPRKWNQMKKLTLAFLLVALAVVQPALAGRYDNVVPTEEDYRKLDRLLEPHTYYGFPVSRGVRAAAGNPEMIVLDRRRFHSTAECGFRTYRHQRIMECR